MITCKSYNSTKFFSRDNSENHFLRKPVFSGFSRATGGSSCKDQEKRGLEKNITADSTIGFLK
ncbi:hypothetical protein BXU01_02220 [[Flexibacter] sp. ATCC 35103]|nr:hypothetical protein BXU01_02220 [[Flexibacter] sp. ATCC 35103]